MARVPETLGDGEVAERIRARRPGGVLRPIDRVLLHSPRLADGWNALLGAIRGGISLGPDLRELVVLRIAVLNEAPYEWASHEADAQAAGLGPAQRDALRRDDAARAPELDELQRAVVRFTDAVTRDLVVPDELFDGLAARLGIQAVVELAATAAAYNMVSRLVVTLGVEAPVGS
ncbi:MAG: Carboxymuconolactone decarboxylase [Nocardioidaceae bacterium]|nr:Carboxymuconolactone decarboxylase [Nocardioidaceae bacterium]